MGKFPPIKKGNPVKVRELYMNGWGISEIAHHYCLHRQSIWRYLHSTGGVSMEDRIEHMRARQRLLEQREISEQEVNKG